MLNKAAQDFSRKAKADQKNKKRKKDTLGTQQNTCSKLATHIISPLSPSSSNRVYIPPPYVPNHHACTRVFIQHQAFTTPTHRKPTHYIVTAPTTTPAHTTAPTTTPPHPFSSSSHCPSPPSPSSSASFINTTRGLKNHPFGVVPAYFPGFQLPAALSRPLIRQTLHTNTPNIATAHEPLPSINMSAPASASSSLPGAATFGFTDPPASLASASPSASTTTSVVQVNMASSRKKPDFNLWELHDGYTPSGHRNHAAVLLHYAILLFTQRLTPKDAKAVHHLILDVHRKKRKRLQVASDHDEHTDFKNRQRIIAQSRLMTDKPTFLSNQYSKSCA